MVQRPCVLRGHAGDTAPAEAPGPGEHHLAHVPAGVRPDDGEGGDGGGGHGHLCLVPRAEEGRRSPAEGDAGSREFDLSR